MIKKTIEELNAITDEVRAKFGGLSGDEINRKPNPRGWSVAQCLDHLIKTNELFFGELDSLALNSRHNSFWENWSPFTKIGGRFLINSLKSDAKKFKVPTKAIAPPSECDPKMVEIFAAHQAELTEKLAKCASANVDRTVVTSPFLKLMTYTLADGLDVIVEHERRHVRQAARVIEAIG